MISDCCISSAWLRACCHLEEKGGKDTNLCIALQAECEENVQIRKILDQEYHKTRKGNFNWIDKVRDTIFPEDLYRTLPHDEAGEARLHLYKMQSYRREFLLRKMHSRTTYFDKMINWPNKSTTGNHLNQLEENIIEPLLREKQKGKKNANFFQLSVIPLESEYSIRLYDPTKDRRHRGGPCLTHISISLFNGQIDMTAMYRNHSYMTKVYGNLLGLRSLQKFISAESGYKLGELLCVSAHADLYDSFKVSQAKSILGKCNSVLAKSFDNKVVAG